MDHNRSHNAKEETNPDDKAPCSVQRCAEDQSTNRTVNSGEVLKAKPDHEGMTRTGSSTGKEVVEVQAEDISRSDVGAPHSHSSDKAATYVPLLGISEGRDYSGQVLATGRLEPDSETLTGTSPNDVKTVPIRFKDTEVSYPSNSAQSLASNAGATGGRNMARLTPTQGSNSASPWRHPTNCSNSNQSGMHTESNISGGTTFARNRRPSGHLNFESSVFGQGTDLQEVSCEVVADICDQLAQLFDSGFIRLTDPDDDPDWADEVIASFAKPSP